MLTVEGPVYTSRATTLSPLNPPAWQVTHEFGNVFKCHASGMTHVCDANCNQRLQYDRYSSICRVSKRVVPLAPQEQSPDEAAR